MRLGIVGNLKAHAGSQHERPAVFEPCVQLAFKTEKDVPLRAPMICDVPRRAFHHAQANGATFDGAPAGNA